MHSRLPPKKSRPVAECRKDHRLQSTSTTTVDPRESGTNVCKAVSDTAWPGRDAGFQKDEISKSDVRDIAKYLKAWKRY